MPADDARRLVPALCAYAADVPTAGYAFHLAYAYPPYHAALSRRTIFYRAPRFGTPLL